MGYSQHQRRQARYAAIMHDINQQRIYQRNIDEAHCITCATYDDEAMPCAASVDSLVTDYAKDLKIRRLKALIVSYRQRIAELEERIRGYKHERASVDSRPA